MDPAAIAKCRDLIQAAIVVDTYGRKADVDGIYEAMKKYPSDEPVVIQDLAEAHGVGMSVNASAACWSFYKNKLVAGEEGGMVWFKKDYYADQARKLRCLGFTEDHDFRHIPRGHNYRLANCLAQKIISSINTYDAILKGHCQRYKIYELKCPAAWRLPEHGGIIPWVYPFRIEGMNRRQQWNLIRSMRLHGLQPRHGFQSSLFQAEYMAAERFQVGAGTMESVKASEEVIYLPLGAGEFRADFDSFVDFMK